MPSAARRAASADFGRHWSPKISAQISTRRRVKFILPGAEAVREVPLHPPLRRRVGLELPRRPRRKRSRCRSNPLRDRGRGSGWRETPARHETNSSGGKEQSWLSRVGNQYKSNKMCSLLEWNTTKPVGTSERSAGELGRDGR